MENIRNITILIILILAIFPTAAFAYEVSTHEGLTQATIQAYEKLHSNVFSTSDEQNIVSGSSGEDATPRPLNHFYDPINYRGLTIGFSWQPSEEWAQDTEGQGKYCSLDAVGARRFCIGALGYNDKLFSSPTDFSWNRAIYEYAWGNKTRALETLGHVLHLLQDATVPAHVRNGQHLNHNGFGDPDPYEGFASAFGPGKVTAPATLNVPAYSSLNAYFDHVANFTNTHFVSKDTLFKDYALPDFNKLDIRGGFAYDPKLGHKVARVETTTNPFTHKVLHQDILIDNLEHSVASDNWSVLSKEAIQNGMGVVDLFFKKVEEEKKTEALKAKNVSAAERDRKKFTLGGFGVAKAIFGSSLNRSDVEELLNDNAGQAGTAALAAVNTKPVQEEVVSTSAALSPIQVQVQQATQPMQNNPAPVPQSAPSEPANAAPSPTPPPPIPLVPQPRLNPITPGFGGGGGAQSAPSTQGNSGGSGERGGSGGSGSNGSGGSGNNPSPSPSPSAPPFTVTSPSESAVFATTSVSFAGTTSPSALVSASFGSRATTTADSAGNWRFSFTLPEGTTAVSFAASDSAGHASATTTRAVVVDLTPPRAPSVHVHECNSSLSTSTCLIAATTATVSWNAISDATYYGVAKNGSHIATTTATSAAVNVADNATTTFAVIAYDMAGNAATSTPVSVEVNTRPLIINEIAWAGTDANPADEWIELKNMSGRPLDLSHVAILSADGSPYIQLAGILIPIGSFVNEGYYLIERRQEATDKQASLVSAFDQLSDSGEELLLQWGNGVSTTTIDRTPAVATCSGWCAGSAAAAISFSEQTGATTTAKVSMERVGSGDGALAGSWASNDTYIRQVGDMSRDASSTIMNATPGSANSAHLPSIGWYCGSDAPVVPGATYHPSSVQCTYLSAFLGTQAGRLGDIYAGTVGSSTVVTGHLIGPVMKREQNDALPTDTAPGQRFFTVIYEGRNYGNDLGMFRNYFIGVNPTPPHNNYWVIPWVYGP